MDTKKLLEQIGNMFASNTAYLEKKIKELEVQMNGRFGDLHEKIEKLDKKIDWVHEDLMEKLIESNEIHEKEHKKMLKIYKN